jgi:hypothetical protein
MDSIAKKKGMAEPKPNFSHEEGDVTLAIGVPNLIPTLTAKLKKFSENDKINSPSKVVDYFYNNMSKLELAFMAMHSLGQTNGNEEEEAQEGI